MKSTEKKEATKKIEEDVRWRGLSVDDVIDDLGGIVGTEIEFEISGEKFGDGGATPFPKMSGTIKGETTESVREALGTIIGMFVAKTMNRDGDEGE